jgi:hypothetical protein
MGFYSVTPGQDIYIIGSPLFEKATINLENNKQFIIVAKNVSDKNIYIQSASLNGSNYTKSYLKHQDIINGGTLVFVMGEQPNKNWGASPEDRPYTLMGEEMTALPYIKSGAILFENTTEINLACSTEGSEIRFTLDGTDPTENSDLYTNPIKFKETKTLKIRSFHKDLKPSITIEYEIKKAVFKEALKNVEIKRGLHYDYFEKFFVTTEDMDGLTPLKSGTMDTFTIQNAKVASYFGYQFEGYIKIPKDGIYTFYLESNDGSTLFIDGIEIVENEANHGAVEEPGDIALKKGLHHIKVRYFQCGGGKMLQLSYSSSEISKQEIPASILFQNK